MKNCFRGSEWRKWDFHIHTPFSFFHQFDGDYSEEGSKEFENSFDKYVKKLFSAAIENNIAAIGITDYFRIDGYKKITTEYLSNHQKLVDLFEDESIIEKIKQIFVFPNIEMRLNCFVGRNSESIDFHFIFSDTIPVETIEENFIKKLEFVYDTPSGSMADKRSISNVNVSAFGKKLKQEQGFSGNDLSVGYEHLTLDVNDIIKVLQEISDFKDNYLTIVDDDKLGIIPWEGRDHSTRKAIVKRSDMQFSNNNSNIAWGLGQRGYDSPNGFVAEFGHFLPSVTGSDAHSFDELFVSEQELYCWVKANADFEGLRQVIFEPMERVKIQTTKPEEKNGDKVIDHIVINDPPHFTAEPIYFSENLTCIIGGKSTGKSVLLREIAKTVDHDQVVNREREVFDKPKAGLQIENVRVFWKDGSEEHEKRKIVYIPQTYLNRLSDEEQEETQIDELIEKVLFQNPIIYEGYERLGKELQKEKELAGKMILEYVSLYEHAAKTEEKLKENGDSKTINKLITELQAKIDEIAKKLNISEEDIAKYNTSKARIDFLDAQAKDLATDSELICDSDLVSEITDMTSNLLKQFKVPKVKEDFKVKVDSFIAELEKQWAISKTEMTNKLEEIKTGGEKERLQIQGIIDELQPIIEKTEEIKELTAKKLAESERKKRAEALESELTRTLAEKEELQGKIINIPVNFQTSYSKYVSIANEETAKFPNSDMTFNACVVFRKNKFIETMLDIFNRRTLASDIGKTMRDEPDKLSEEDFTCSLPKKLLDDVELDKIKLVKGQNLETVLRNLFSDWFNIDYSVDMGRDSIKNMSPGKKALVLLRLLLELAQSDFPILIDQPEDDLDNRSIYNDIVKYIKSKKKERQIIIVTHNANVVLGSDAELIIIANQDGHDCKNDTARFEYRSGAIEDNIAFEKNTEVPKKGILYKAGVRDQICDILEGGADAFNLRENKYSIL